MKFNTSKKYLATQVVLANLAISSGMFAVHSFAEEKTMEEVVVTASFRDSLKVALDVKRNSAGMVDSIMAEDIADFPDTNLAESMQRIPGVAITKEAGEGREITVRGLSSTYTRVMINNAMGQSLAAGSGGVRTTRAFDFNVFASEMFNRLDVHKSQSAELEEGSLGATVNLHTGRPFDYDKKSAVLNIQAAYNDQSGETTPRTSGLFSYTNEDETFGGLVSFAYAQRNVDNTGADTGRWEDDIFKTCSACSTSADKAAVDGAWHPRFPRVSEKNHDQDRTGITASLQFKPSDATLITLDGMYANLESTRLEPYMEAISLARSSSGKLTGLENVSAYTIDSNNSLIAATIDNVDVRSEAFRAQWESEFKQYALTVDHEFNDSFRVKAMVASSDSNLDNREQTLIYEHFDDGDARRNGGFGQVINYAESSSTVSYDFTNMLNPEISYSFDTSNPANWAMSEWRDRVYDASSGSDSAKLDFQYDLNDVFTLKFGASNREYSYDIVGTRADNTFDKADKVDGTADGNACGVGVNVTSSMGSVITAGGQTFFQADQGAFNSLASNTCWPQKPNAGDTRNVTEDVTGYYVQLDFDTDINGHMVKGNVGVRNVTTDLDATGVNSSQTVSVKHSYDDTLPSLNLAYGISEDLIARFGWAKVMSRANLTDLNPGGSVTIFGDPKVSYGNPYIEPFRATNIDVSLEWYFAEGSLLSLAYFDKDIESFPSSETVTLNWKETGLPDSLLGAQVDFLKDADFLVSRKTNGGGGKLSGYEIQYQQNLTFLPEGWMQNLGIIANMTSVDSEQDSNGLPLTGQSDTSYNFTAFYEDDLFSTRLAYSYRGDYIASHNSDSNKTQYRDPAKSLDYSASYKINENLRIKFDALNLTNEQIVDMTAPGIGRVTSVQNTGRQYMLGVTYKF